MSLERAYVNCKRCFYFADCIKKENKNYKVVPEDFFYQSDDLHGARNEALRALEEKASETIVEKNIKKLLSLDCIGCDFSSPKIANSVRAYRDADELPRSVKK
ncbi:MAG: hypothetical protein AABW82_04885 [Nanoarchaeota archaeon]